LRQKAQISLGLDQQAYLEAFSNLGQKEQQRIVEMLKTAESTEEN